MKIKLDLLREGDVIRLEPLPTPPTVSAADRLAGRWVLSARGEESMGDHYHRLNSLQTGRITALLKSTTVFWYAFDQITNPPLPLTR